MDDLSRFEKICLAMAVPSFYPHPVESLERRDSHISAVFLTGSWAYKLKKPFDFGFLDYTDLEKRRHMCEREVELNQRLSVGVYEEVVEIRRSGEEFHLGGEGEIVEYAVKMKQLSDNEALSSLLSRDGIGLEQMNRLGRVLGTFYSRGRRSPEIDRYGQADTISFNTEENFRQIQPFVGVLVSNNRFEVVREASRGFFRDRIDIFEKRIETGRICDGHGDLRAEHVYFSNGEIQILDCIEFNERFRYGDAAVDLAFLHMDLERLGRPDLSLAVLTGYIEESGDFGVYSVLDFYSCYRALVKLKVACLTWEELEDGARKEEMKARAVQFLDLAFRYAIQFSRPTIWVFCGLPGSGKSTVAEKVRETFGIPILRSDQVRTTLPEYSLHTGPVPVGTGLYRPELRGRVYAHMLSLAHAELKKGASVVLDGTFSKRHWREEAMQLARDLDAGIVFFECVSSEPALLERLGRRDREEERQPRAGSREERQAGKPAPQSSIGLRVRGTGEKIATERKAGKSAPHDPDDPEKGGRGARRTVGSQAEGAGSRDGPSDARPEHLIGLLGQFEPLDELSPEYHASIDTESNDPDQCLRLVLAKAYLMKQEQVRDVMKRL